MYEFRFQDARTVYKPREITLDDYMDTISLYHAG